MTGDLIQAGVPMKVTIEIDCTPIEARQFLGLPNVEPMQAAVMQQLEKRMSQRSSVSRRKV